MALPLQLVAATARHSGYDAGATTNVTLLPAAAITIMPSATAPRRQK
jgi:hypothetical protein